MTQKKIHRIVAALILGGLIVATGGPMTKKPSPVPQEKDTKALWKKVDDADKNGLPQTALEALKQIVPLAFAQKNNGEALRALTRQIILETAVAGNKPEVRVARLKEEIGKAPAEVRPMMKTILAQWYWQYYSRNRWRFMNRTATEGADDKDFTTWDLPRIFKEIDGLYHEILKDEAALKKTAIAAYKDLLQDGNQPASFRPTIFDFVVFEALEFYTSGEQTAAAPEDAFVIEAESDAFAPAARFISYVPATSDAESPKLQALKLYQKALDFHRKDANPDAFLDADLQRLRYVRNTAAGEQASDLFLKRLREISKSYAASPLASLALSYEAQEIFDRGDYVRALEAARSGEKAHPASVGGSDCKALIAQITAREFQLHGETVLRPGLAGKMAFEYRNLTTLHLRAVKTDFTDASGLSWMPDAVLVKLLAAEPAAVWKTSMKPTADYKSTTTLADIPPLKPGFYRILASANESFMSPKNKVQVATLCVSDLGLVTRGSDGSVQGLVVRNEAGEPVGGAEVTLYQWDSGADVFRKVVSTRTDDGGAFVLSPGQDGRGYARHLLAVRDDKGGEVAELQVPRSYPRSETPRTTTMFFTDRSIYRPGQTISFKGICLAIDTAGNDYRLLSKKPVRVVFRDANRQDVASLLLTTNDYGSFSGAFTAPADRLTGEMSISTQDPRGQTSVRVEEYKRPKFQVKLDVPDQEFRLNDEVALPGEALAYTGAPVDGALVKYRIVREVQYPWWWFYWSPRPERGGSQEIAHGTLRTDEAGKFAIKFQAKPDPAIAASGGPVFTFAAYVDVTDTTGETRSAEGRVRAGFASLEAGLRCGDWQESGKPVALTVTTTTLNGKKASAKGTVEVVALRGPDKPVPADLIGEAALQGRETSATSDWRRWPDGALVERKEFQTNAKDEAPLVLSYNLKPGAYKARLKTRDKSGSPVESLAFFLVLDPASPAFSVKIPFHTAARASTVEVGGTYEILWGTGYGRGPVLIEVFQNGKAIKRAWTETPQTQGVLRVPVDEKLRGGFTVLITAVKENRIYTAQERVNVPWSNKALALQWQTFRSKLQPGQKETWSVRIRGPQASIKAAEMVAALYDVSLDQFTGHGFPAMSGIFKTDGTYVYSTFANRKQEFQTYLDDLNAAVSSVSPSYVRFQPDIEFDSYGYNYPGRVMKSMARPEAMAREGAEPPPPPSPTAAAPQDSAKGGVVGGVVGGVLGGAAEDKKAAPAVDLSKVQARKNLDETAFFYPLLLTDKDGVVTLEFKMPEALTEWRFLGFAHTRELESGSLEGRTVTQKDLMVQPNPPRFLREGDALEFTVKVTNMTEKDARGDVQLTFFDPRTDKSLDTALGNGAPKMPFAVPAKQSRSFSWPLAVPDGLEIAGFKAVAASAEFSDGEEGVLPVLSRRILVRESIPLWINDKGQKKFEFKKLAQSSTSGTLTHVGLVVQMASNPAWYAIQALPFLMEYPYECSEQVFNRLYANGLAQKIANADPRVRKIFDLWKGTPALKSNLEKNEDLKSVLLQESPWVLDARAETQARQNVGLLFDENRMGQEIKRAFGKLEAMQLSDGSWPWFPGGRGDSYITLYLVTGFGRLKHLDVAAVPQTVAVKALGRLDGWIRDTYDLIVKAGHKDENHLSSTIALFLYGRSFYLKEQPIPAASRAAVDYFLGQAARYWLQLDFRQSQAHLALALHRFGDTATAQKIMRSMKERSQVDEELGRFWSELELSWWWYRAPIETQAVMIEAFDEVMNDQAAVEECKVWLLKQKQTQDWKTTKATADAVYGLMQRGADLLASDAVVEVSLGGQVAKPEKVEAGTGFYEKRFAPSEIKPEMGNVVVTKTDKGIAWGGLHWQYMEDISKITPHAQNPLKLKKDVFVQRQTKKGPVIEPVKGPLAVGDTLVVRIELRTDRDMEYVHMKDHRGSGLEPVNVLSQYKFQGGLVYYESTKDTATHFFIDYLPKGIYVFEYPLRVVHRGAYQNGMALIECMYAPEFNSHSESVKLEIK
jgi:uncharacterized protein YfaS (alpha-2-macroglobulin family)